MRTCVKCLHELDKLVNVSICSSTLCSEHVAQELREAWASATDEEIARAVASFK